MSIRLLISAGLLVILIGAQSGKAQLPPTGPASAPPVLTLPSSVQVVEPPPLEGPTPSPMGEARPAEESTPAKDCFRVQMQDGSLIIGELADDANLKLRAKIGEVEIELRQVARIDPSLNEKDQITVTLSNGDRLTGKPAMDDVSLKTSWGVVPLTTDGMTALEAGKLEYITTYYSRPSPDGRTMVTTSRKYYRFRATVPSPHEVRPRRGSSVPTYDSYPSPGSYGPDLQPTMPAPTSSLPQPDAPAIWFSPSR